MFLLVSAAALGCLALGYQLSCTALSTGDASPGLEDTPPQSPTPNPDTGQTPGSNPGSAPVPGSTPVPNPSTLAGNCPGQPDQPSSGQLGRPVLRTSFGTGGGWFGSPQALDVNGDGKPELIASGDGVTAYTQDGKTLWHAALSGRCFAGAVLANLDGKGLPEVVAGDAQGTIRAWKALDGTPLTGWPYTVANGAGGNEIRALAAADLDRDGADEVVAFSQLTDSGNLPTKYLLEGNGKVMPGWPQYAAKDPFACTWCGGFNQNIAVADLDSNGVMDVVFNQDVFYQSVFDAKGKPRPVSSLFTDCGSPLAHWGQVKAYLPQAAEGQRNCGAFEKILEFTFSPPTVADLDHDGQLEILSVPNSHDPGDLGTTPGSALTVYNPDRTPRAGFAPYKQSDPGRSLYPGEGGVTEFTPTATAANFTGDSRLEILVTQLDGVARLYDAAGKELWKTPYSKVQNSVVTEPLVADLDQDNVPEAILLVTYPDEMKSTLIVLGGKAGDKRLELDLPFRAVAAPLLADIDNDQALELVFSAQGQAPGIYLYDWPGTKPNCLLWPQGRGNPGHTGSYRR